MKSGNITYCASEIRFADGEEYDPDASIVVDAPADLEGDDLRESVREGLSDYLDKEVTTFDFEEDDDDWV